MFSNLELDLTLYSATSLANAEELFSSKVAGESYSAITPAHKHQQPKNLSATKRITKWPKNENGTFTDHYQEARPCHC